MLAQLQKLLNSELTKFEHNGVTVSNDGGVVQVVATGLFTLPVSFTLNEVQLRLLHNFVNAFNSDEYDTCIVKLDHGIRLVAYSEFQQNELDLNEDSSATVFSGWRSSDYWDKWTVSSDGIIEYAGTVEGYRRVPEWISVSTQVPTLKH